MYRDAGAWSERQVEQRLIAAFRFLPGQPVYSDGHRLVTSADDRAGHASALNWVRDCVPNRQESLALLTWARCRASGDSVRCSPIS